MSIDPMTATTSAMSWPRHIIGSACRFTKEGERKRMRYGISPPVLTMWKPCSPRGLSTTWYTSPAGGLMYFGTLARTSPSGRRSRACWMMRQDWRISSMRTTYRS